MKKGVYRLCSVFLAALILSVVVAPVCAVETDYFSKDTFWRWMAGSGGVVQKIIGYSFSSACSASDDGYHHASSYTREGKDGTYQCNCIYCGDVFIATESDIKQSYNDYVETLPAQGYSSAGHLLIQLAYKPGENLVTKPSNASGSGYPVPYFKEDSSSSVRTDVLDSGKHLTFVRTNLGSGISYRYPYCVYSSFLFPISGFYRMTNSKHCDYTYFCSDSSSAKSFTYYPESSDLSYHKAGDVFSDLGKDYMFPTNFPSQVVLSWSAHLYGPVFEVIPDTALSDDTYNINTRPTSITGGNYGIVGDNGQITKVEDNSTIINETNNTFYNPATGTAVPIVNWSYDYSDRSYKVTLESGDTATITYGDENITISQITTTEGDTITNNYTIYYLVDGSGSTTPPCDHAWTETNTTPATCTVPGSKLSTCSKCQQTKKDPVPALGHDWQIKQTVTTEYDDTGQLTQEGYTIFECSRCKEQYKSPDGTIPPGGGSGTDPGGDEGETIWDKLGNLVGAIGSGVIGLIEAALGKILDALIALVEGMMERLKTVVEAVLSIFDELPKLFGGFLDFLVALFPFLPPELMTILTFGILAVVFIGIIKAVRR